ncbi:MAG: RnfH family protein [Janthinobacterium lividum]
MPVQVCYMAPGVQALIDVEVPPGATLAEAIRASGLCERHPEVDLSTQKVGVHGKVRALDDRLAAHDRVEIYRALTVDPKLARARRVAKARKGGSVEGRKWANREYR